MALETRFSHLGDACHISFGRKLYGLTIASLLAFVLSFALFCAKMLMLQNLNIGDYIFGDGAEAASFLLANIVVAILLGLPLAFIVVFLCGSIAWASIDRAKPNCGNDFALVGSVLGLLIGSLDLWILHWNVENAVANVQVGEFLLAGAFWLATGIIGALTGYTAWRIARPDPIITDD